MTHSDPADPDHAEPDLDTDSDLADPDYETLGLSDSDLDADLDPDSDPADPGYGTHGLSDPLIFDTQSADLRNRSGPKSEELTVQKMTCTTEYR